ncbi:MAG TPA: biotin--[acetyl-CoA-carboxylase] ligase [Armatimonadota bacterium]|jgi:BirA family biotin operon repressor/biotin-[acetyl-CoA-carboxylase] ligase
MLCIYRYDTLGSTNDEAIRLAREGAPAGTVVWAGDQNAGRGRMGRTWEGGAGNVYLSVVTRPEIPVALAGRISVACGLALTDALRKETWQPVRTKWPNDLYLYGRKVGGILVETGAARAGRLEWVVVGVGINVSSHPDVPPPAHPATSLAAHGGAGDIETLIPGLAQAVVHASESVASEAGWASFAARWPAMDLAAGAITVLEGGEAFEAVGGTIEDDGALRVVVGGEARSVRAAEVSIRNY